MKYNFFFFNLVNYCIIYYCLFYDEIFIFITIITNFYFVDEIYEFLFTVGTFNNIIIIIIIIVIIIVVIIIIIIINFKNIIFIFVSIVGYFSHFRFSLFNFIYLFIYLFIYSLLFLKVTCATDTRNVRVVFGACKDIILKKNLQESGFME